MVNLFARYVARFGQEKVAAKLGVSPSMVTRLKNGERRPSLELALKIERLTRGGVNAASWSKTRVRTNARRRS